MKQPLYIVMISVHGLIRGRNLELGRDADTGGQTRYVVELMKAVVAQPEVARVDLATRLIAAPEVDADYARPVEEVAPGAHIVRLSAGPDDQYLHKEALWDHLDSFADNLVAWFDAQERLPDLLHSHYADAGYVAARVSHQLGLPLVHTGHSLGRVKRRRLLATGLNSAEVDERYNMTRRIEAEELTLGTAERVIASTRQEIDQQYSLYDHYQPEIMRVVPPGTDLELFHPPEGGEWDTPMGEELRRFLRAPEKPIVMALSRPDPRKNINALLDAFGSSERLRELANLLVVAGNRDDIADLDEGPRDVLTDLLLRVDLYDLYGKIAYPKHHAPEDVPLLYRLAAARGGVFVNPALTEPFGLTLIEAAASGLPIVATEDGGPRDIIGNCHNGVLIDPLDAPAIARALEAMLEDEDERTRLVQQGLAGVERHYSWNAHAQTYLDVVRPLVEGAEPLRVPPHDRRRPMLYHDRALFTDLDQNLLGSPEGQLPVLTERLRSLRRQATFGIATGRRLDSARPLIKQLGLPEPDVLITSGGTEIHYGPDLTADSYWPSHIDHAWTPQIVRRLLADVPGITPQAKREQSRFKLSYYYDPAEAPPVEEISALLRGEGLSINLILSFGQYLDILPIRASKGLALRYVAHTWGIALERILVAGGSGADEDMMRGNTLAVMVSNRHHEELSHLGPDERIYAARASHAAGILEAIDYFDFAGACAFPDQSHDG